MKPNDNAFRADLPADVNGGNPTLGTCAPSDTISTTLPDDLIIDPPPVVYKALGVSNATLIRWRAVGEGPPFIMLTLRKVGYRRSEWRAWLSQRTFTQCRQGVAAIKRERLSSSQPEQPSSTETHHT
jgi:predicted DNA-binding transcriptional regulator AlpA